METLNRPKYTWENKLSNADRQQIIDYYIQGYAPYTLMRAYNVSQCTIEHHLKAAGVYILFRKATKKGPIKRQQLITFRSITLPPTRRLVTKLDNDKYWYDEYGQQYKNVTKSYKDFIQEAANRPRIIRDNERIENKGAGDNFITMIRVSIKESPQTQSFFASQSIYSF